MVKNSKDLINSLLGYSGPPVRIMEVCGTHTMAVARYGIHQALPEGVELISGPGCPVCVCEPGVISSAVRLSSDSGAILSTFGDMLAVPAKEGSLAEARAHGADVRVVYSPAQAVTIAEENPDRRVVFLAVGFETTAPAIASTVKMGYEKNLSNLSFLVSMRTIPEALRALAGDPESGISGFLLPGHVSVIIGQEPYQDVLSSASIPAVIAGFTANDILLALNMLLSQATEGRAQVENGYRRAVNPEGNAKAQELIKEVFTPCDITWRGLGIIPKSGLALAEPYQELDARSRLGAQIESEAPPAGCRCGEVLAGRISPPQCGLFSTTCTPQSPVGPCMVSSEGTCAAYYKYRKR